MVTDEDRAYSAKAAKLIAATGLNSVTHFATNMTVEESFRRGFLCECAMANRFGLRVATRKPTAVTDGGLDFLVWMRGRRGPLKVPIDVKCTSIRSNIDATHLCVPVSDIGPNTLYVYGVYWTRTDDAEVLRWEWGRTLLNRNDVQVLKNNAGRPQYVMPFPELRHIDELDSHIVEQVGVTNSVTPSTLVSDAVS